MQKLIVRKGKQEDIPQVHQLVGELAEYEHAKDEFICPLNAYIKLFKENNWSFLVAVDGNIIIGACIFYYGFSTWKGKFLYLEDFIVTSNERRKGAGRKLFDQLIKIAVDNNCNLMRWQVLDWNEPAINFYKKYDAQFEKGWVNCKLSI